jgi:hypothetical protein
MSVPSTYLTASLALIILTLGAGPAAAAPAPLIEPQPGGAAPSSDTGEAGISLLGWVQGGAAVLTALVFLTALWVVLHDRHTHAPSSA